MGRSNWKNKRGEVLDRNESNNESNNENSERSVLCISGANDNVSNVQLS